MEFRHFFINNDKMDYFYMNFLRPFGYISLLYPSEKIRLLIERSEYTYLKKYHNAYKGKRCFIVGTGPSLKKDELKMIQGEFILGVNSLCLWKDVLPFIDFFLLVTLRLIKNLILSCQIKHLFLIIV